MCACVRACVRTGETKTTPRYTAATTLSIGEGESVLLSERDGEKIERKVKLLHCGFFFFFFLFPLYLITI